MSLTSVRSIGVATILAVVAAMASCGGGSVENDKADVPVATEKAPLAHDPDLERRFRSFMAIRTEVRRMADTIPDDGSYVPAADRLTLMKEVREEKEPWLAEAGLTLEEYEDLRRALLTWEHGDRLDPQLQTLFDSNRDRLEGLDLGWLEGIDAAPEDPATPQER